MYQPRAGAGLDAMARLCGFPGKLGMDGSAVHGAIRRGQARRRPPLLRNRRDEHVSRLSCASGCCAASSTAGEYAKEVSLARERIAAIRAPHWAEFIAAWDANVDGREPRTAPWRASATRQARTNGTGANVRRASAGTACPTSARAPSHRRCGSRARSRCCRRR